MTDTVTTHPLPPGVAALRRVEALSDIDRRALLSALCLTAPGPVLAVLGEMAALAGASAPVCVACVGDRTDPGGGPCRRCRGTGADRTRRRRRGWRHDRAETDPQPARARALREAAGTITGHALEGGDVGPRDVLTDVLAVFGSDAGLRWGDLAARLASRFPARWDGVTADSISTECRERGVPSVNVRGGDGQGKGCRRADVGPLAGAS